MKSSMVVIVILHVISAVPVRRNPDDYVIESDSNSNWEKPVILYTSREDEVTNTTPVSFTSEESEEYSKEIPTPVQWINIPSVHIPSELTKNLMPNKGGFKGPRQTDDVKQKYVELVKKFKAENEFPEVVPYAAFAGDYCATGFMRFGEICIDGDA